jgi:hypothetical protein
MALPALLAGMLFGPLHRLPWLRRRWFRAGLVFGGALVWLLSATFAVALLYTNSFSLVVTVPSRLAGRPEHLPLPDLAPALALALHPAVLATACAIALALAWWESRQKNAPAFPLGLFLGVLAVLATLALNALVLVGGGTDNWRGWAVVVGLAHLPLAVLEGVVLGFTVGFLVRVKPELLNGYRPAPPEDRPEAAPTAAPLPESSQ